MPTSVHSCHILRQADRHFDQTRQILSQAHGATPLLFRLPINSIANPIASMVVDAEAMLFATMLLDPRHDFLFADTADLPITILLHHIGALEVDFTVALVLLIRNLGNHVDLLNHGQYADDPLVIFGPRLELHSEKCDDILVQTYKGFARGGGVNSAFPGYSVVKDPLFHVTAELLSLSLGNFAWFWLVSVGVRFINERQIWGAGPLQYFPFSPPAEERDQRA
jgi:hypothetical protein